MSHRSVTVLPQNILDSRNCNFRPSATFLGDQINENYHTLCFLYLEPTWMLYAHTFWSEDPDVINTYHRNPNQYVQKFNINNPKYKFKQNGLWKRSVDPVRLHHQGWHQVRSRGHAPFWKSGLKSRKFSNSSGSLNGYDNIFNPRRPPVDSMVYLTLLSMRIRFCS